MGNRFCWGWIAVPVLLCCFGCTTTDQILRQIDKPSIKGVYPKIAGIDFQGVDLLFDVDVLNPYSFPIHSPRFKYGLQIQQEDLVQSEVATNLDLPAGKIGTVKLPVRVGYADLWRTYQGLKDQAEVDYTLHGALLLDALGETVELPMAKSGVLPVLRIPTLSALKVELKEVSYNQAKLVVDTALKNPNAFPLDIQDLGYILRLGDLEIGGLSALTQRAIEPGKEEPVTLNARISGIQAVTQLLSGGSIGAAKISPTGRVRTPYGSVSIPQLQ